MKFESSGAFEVLSYMIIGSFSNDDDKTSRQEISRPSRAVTAKKCTKMCNARAEFFFWLLSILFF